MKPPVGRSVVLVITSNRGLCGGYNASQSARPWPWSGRSKSRPRCRPAANRRPYLCGKKGIAYFRFLGRKPVASYTKFEDKRNS